MNFAKDFLLGALDGALCPYRLPSFFISINERIDQYKIYSDMPKDEKMRFLGNRLGTFSSALATIYLINSGSAVVEDVTLYTAIVTNTVDGCYVLAKHISEDL